MSNTSWFENIYKLTGLVSVPGFRIFFIIIWKNVLNNFYISVERQSMWQMTSHVRFFFINFFSTIRYLGTFTWKSLGTWLNLYLVRNTICSINSNIAWKKITMLYNLFCFYKMPIISRISDFFINLIYLYNL